MKNLSFITLLVRKTPSGFVGWMLVLLYLVMATSSLSAATVTWSGATNGNWNDAGNWDTLPVAGDDLHFFGSANLATTNDFPVDISFNSITFDSGAGAFTLSGNRITLAGNITNNDDDLQTINLAMIVNGATTINTAFTGNITLGGVVSGTGSLTKDGTQTLNLRAANTYSGGTTLNGGITSPTDNTAFGSGTVTCASGTTIGYGLGGNHTLANAIVLMSGTVTFTVPFGGGTDLAFTGIISGAGAVQISGDVNSRLLRFTGANTYTGGTTLGSGADVPLIDIGTSTALGTGTLVVNIPSGVNGGVVTSAAVTVANPITINSGKLLTLGQRSSTPSTFSGVISGAGSLAVISSTYTLSGANTYTGATTVSAGTLSLASSGSFGDTAIAVANGATFAPNPGSGTVSAGTTGAGVAGATLTLASGAIFDQTDAAVGGFNLQQNASFASTALTIGGAVLNFNLSSSGADVFASTLVASCSGTNSIGVTTVGTSLTAGSYNIITASSGLDGGTWQFVGGGTTKSVTAGSNAYLLTLSNTATAVTITVSNPINVWNGTTSTDWNVASNWSALYVPGANTDIQIGNGSGGNALAPSVTAAGGTCNSITFMTTAAAVGAGTGTLTIGAGGISASVTGSSIACPVALGAAQSWDTGANTLDVSGVISGSGALTKTGAGTLTLSGANSLSGGLTLSAGTLNINHATALGTGTFTIADGTTIDNSTAGAITLTANNPQTWNGNFTFTGTNALNLGSGAVAMGGATRQVTVSASTLTVGGVIGGSGGLTKAGAGTLTLGGASTYSGATQVSAGTLKLQNMSVIPGLYEGMVSNSDSFDITTAIPHTSVELSARWGDSTNIGGTNVFPSWGNTTTWGYSGYFRNPSPGNVLYTFGKDFDDGGLLIIDGTTILSNNVWNENPTATALLTPGWHTIEMRFGQGAGGSGPVSNIFASHGLAFSTNGGGSWSAFSDPGDGSLLATLLLSTSNTLPVTTALMVATGATLDLVSVNQQVASLADVSGGGGSVTNSGSVDAMLTVSGASSTTFSGVFSDGSAKSALTKDGSSTLTLSGTNTYTGATTISTGTLQIGNGSTDGSIATSSSITDNAALIFNLATASTYGNVISGSGTLTKTGAGTLTLSGANSFNGGASLSTGTLNINHATALGTGTFTIAGGTTINNSTAGAITMTANNPQTWNGDFTFTGTNDLNLGTGAVALGATTRQVTVSASTLTIGGVIGGTGGLTKVGTGTWTLSGANTYTGTTTVSAGTVKTQGTAFWTTARTWSIASGAVLNIDGDTGVALGTTTLTGAGTLRMTGGTFANEGPNSPFGSGRNIAMSMSSGGVIDVQSGSTVINGGYQSIDWTGNLADLNVDGALSLWDGNTVIVDALTGAGGVSSGANGGVTLSVGADNGSGTFSGVFSSTNALIKTGSGTQMLSGVNTYTGTTTVSAGTLLVTGATHSSSTVTVASGATLGGNGIVAGTIAVSAGGTLAPGTGGTTIGNLNTGAVSLASSGVLSVDLVNATPANEKMTTTGTFTCTNGTLTVASVTSPAPGTVYTIVSATAISGTFSGLAEGATFSQQNHTFQISYLGNQVTLTDMPTTRTWDGGSLTTNNWTDAANWVGDGVPNAGDYLVFAGAARFNPCVNDFAPATNFANITFDNTASPFVLSGNSITLAGNITNNDADTQTINLPVSISVERFVATTSGNIDLGGVISGAGRLTHAGPNVLTLSGTNLFTGGVKMTGGTVSVSADANLGDISGTLITGYGGSGTLRVTGTAFTTTTRSVDWGGFGGAIEIADVNNVFTLNQSFAFGLHTYGPGKLVLTGSSNLSGLVIHSGILAIGAGGVSGAITGGDIINSSALEFNRSDASSFAGIISDTGTVTKLGAGTLTLSGASTYTGATTISGGTISVSSLNKVSGGTVSSNLGAPTSAGNGTIAIGSTATAGTLLYTGTGEITDRVINLTGTTGGGVVDQSGTGLLKFTSALTATGVGVKALTLQGSTAGAGEINAAIVDSSTATALTKTGSGAWMLTGTNTYTGATIISAGTLQIGAGGTTGALSTSSAITNNATLAFNRTNTITQGTDFASVISGSGAVIQQGAGGTLVLNGSNTYTGTTSVQDGTLSMNTILDVSGGASAVGAPTSAANGTIALGSSTTTGTLVYTGTAQNTDRVIDLAGTTGGGIIDQSGTGLLKFTSALTATGAGVKTLTLQGSTAGTGEINAAIVDSSSATALAKSGSGTWTLSGTNAYSGATTVNAGTLLVNGSIATSSAVTLASSAIIGGTGTTSGVTNNGGTIRPGSVLTKSTLTASSVNCSGGTNSTVAVRVAGYTTPGTNYDRLTMSGALTLGGSSILSIDVTGLSGAGTATGVIQSGSIVGTFAVVQITNNTNGLTINVVYNSTSIDLVVANSPPVLAAIEAGTLAYTENDAATAITATTTVADVDSANLVSAVVQITGNYQNGQDVLSYVQVGNIVGTWTAGSGTMTLVGVDTLANYALALRAVKYQNTSDIPSTTVRTVSFIANDGTDSSIVVTRTITITATNDAPVLAAIEAGTLTYTENDAATAITATTTVADVDSANLVSAVVQITGNYQNGQDELAYIQVGNIVGTWTVGSGTMTLVGADTLANYALALRAVKYQNTSDNPSTTVRTVSFIANDGTDPSNTVTRTITITATNDAPVLAAIEVGTLAYTQNAAATAITATTTVADVDNVNLASATVQITGNYQSGQDVLSYVQVGNIVGTWTVGSGTMSLVGSDTLANYRLALRATSYQNTSVNPNTSVRTVSFIANDGMATSNTVTRTVTITAVNAPPIVTLPGGGVTWIEGATATDVAPAGTITDIDSVDFLNGNLTVNITDALGGEIISLRNDGNGVGQIGLSAATVSYGGVAIGTLSGGSGGAPLILSFTSTNATPAAAQAALRALQFMGSGQLLSATTRTIQVLANDGHDASVAVTTTVTLVPVDDPPQATNSMLVTVTDVPAEGVLSGSDPENAALTWQIVSAPASGTLTLLNAATGAVRYDPAAGATGDITFTARVSDGTTWSSPATITIRITDRLAAVRPLILSAPPREGVLGAPLTYQITTQLGALPSGSDLAFRLVGIPAGSTATVTKTSAISATITWTATGTPQQHQQIGLIVSDPVTGISSYQAIQVLWQITAPAGPG
jgi:fibronectin-binding autotransporter adhesin